MRVALLNGNLVVNVCEAPQGWQPDAPLTMQELPANSPVCPGWTFNGATFDPPPPPPPPTTLEVLGEVVRALGRLTLDEVNTLRGRVGLNLRTEAQLLDAVKDLVQGQPWTLGNPSVLTAAQQRAGLGLGDSATRHVGEAAGTVCAGDDARLAAVAGEAFPVGSVFITVVATDPATLLGYGTWQAFGAGRVLVGIDAGDPDFDTVEETGGTKDVALTEQQIPAHSHLTQRYPQTTGPNSGFTADTSMNGAPTANTLPTAATGGGQAHTNLQPYILVHMWKRTA